MIGAFEQALIVLNSGTLTAKTEATHALAEGWEQHAYLGSLTTAIPDTPARPTRPVLVAPADVPRRRLGSVAGRCALLHAIAHIEFNAIDLAVDMIARFGNSPEIPEDKRAEFVGDWIKVADDEARHFGLVRTRLQELGQDYGDHPAHNGLWEAALATKDNFAARLAIAPMVLEARGLDVTPAMIEKFKRFDDPKSADILTIIYEDEITHVATGAKWFHFVAERMETDSEILFKNLIEQYFKGILKPPFNHPARQKAGVPQRYYA